MRHPTKFAAAILLLSATAAPSRAADPDDAKIGRAVYVGAELLRDYNPTPALVTRQTPVAKPQSPVIDIHCHWSLQQDPHAMLKAMDDLGVQRAVNLSGGFGKELDQMLEKFTRTAPDRLFIFCNIDFSRIDELTFPSDTCRYLEDAHRKGVRGLKIFKTFGLTVKDKSGHVVPIDDPRMDPVWDKCAELHMPVLIHSADPVAFFQPIDEHNERWMQLKRHPDWSFYGPAFPPRQEVLDQRNRVIARHPRTTFIGAHIAEYSEDLRAASDLLDRLPNLVVDLSGRVAELGRQPYTARKFLLKYQDRVLFGTDRYPGRLDQPRNRIYYRFLETDDEYFNYYDHPYPPSGDWRIYGVYLPEDVLEKIYHLNAERVLGLQSALPAQGREPGRAHPMRARPAVPAQPRATTQPTPAG